MDAIADVDDESLPVGSKVVARDFLRCFRAIPSLGNTDTHHWWRPQEASHVCFWGPTVAV